MPTSTETPKLDLELLRKPEFVVNQVAFRIRKMPAVQGMHWMNAVRGELGRDNRPANAMSVALTTVDVTQRLSTRPEDITMKDVAGMLQSFLEIVFGLSDGFVEYQVRQELFRYIDYRSPELTGNQWFPLWNGSIDNTNEATDDWALVLELMVRAVVVNFTDSSRLREWIKNIGRWASSQSLFSE